MTTDVDPIATDPAAPTQSAQLRALLFTDLCDSVALVERVGDAAAVELFQQHDRLVLGLQQRWNGQLIDRSDGLFLLFERPVDALGFALAYQQGLRELGEQSSIELCVRAGLHVGEVIVWKNAADAVALGAKQVEVEGLAKPMAARLMQLARPGQLLVSATAESMVRRSAARMSDGPQALQWTSCGRWRFKGVAQPMEVFAVQAPGMPRTRRPRQSDKATRDIPLWRRPLAIVAQAALALSLLIGGWFLTRSPPVIAFAERDWVVLADVHNTTGETIFDDSMRQALLVGLEQSKYINVLAQGKVSESLEMARVPVDSPLSMALAVDVANREGARAVLLPSVVPRAGGYEVRIELVDPTTSKVVQRYAARADVLDDSVAAVGTVVEEVREGLGESMKGLSESVPLPLASTRNLRALRAYALAEKALAQRRFDEAMQLYRAAIELDPEFALAYTSIARLYARVANRAEARVYLEKAMGLQSRLPHRERLYLRGWQAELEAAGWPLESWRVLASMYPDSFAGLSNASWYLLQENRFKEAEPLARAASVPQDHLRSWPMVLLARIQLAMNQPEAALQTLKQVAILQHNDIDDTQVDVLIALRRYPEAESLLERLGSGQDDLNRLMIMRAHLLLAADRGDCSQVVTAVSGNSHQMALADYQVQQELMHATGSVLCSSGSARQLGALGDQLTGLLRDRDHPNLRDRTLQLLGVVYLAQRDGQRELASRLLRDNMRVLQAQRSPVTRRWLAVTQAMEKLQQGQADQALRLLSPLMDGSEPYQAHVVMLHAHRMLNDAPAVKVQQDWLANHRGVAIAEVPAMQLWQALNVHDAATWSAPAQVAGAP